MKFLATQRERISSGELKGDVLSGQAGSDASDRAAWTRLFKQTFVFTGGEIVNEFLLSTGYLPGAHDPDCPVYHRINDLTSARR